MAQLKDDGLAVFSRQFFCNDTGTILVCQSKTEESRDVGRRFGPLRRVLDERLRAESIDNENIVPSIDVRSQTLNVADRNWNCFRSLQIYSCW